MAEDTPEPPTDFFIDAIINTFLRASKERAYIGMAAAPLPLSTSNISNVVNVHYVPLSREVLDACVFAIDECWLKANTDITSKETQ